MPHLLMVSFHFPPSTNVGVHRSARFARRLGSEGWRVSVLTTTAPGSAAADSKMREVRVHRAPVLHPFRAASELRRSLLGERNGAPPAASGGTKDSAEESGDPPSEAVAALSGRWQAAKDAVTGLFSFPDRNVGWIPFAIPIGLDVVRQGGVDAIYTSGPPHSSHLVGLALKRLTGRPWIADFRDPWTRRPWMSDAERASWQHRARVKLERLLVGRADRLVLNTERLRDDFLAHHKPADPSRFVWVTNGFDPAELPPDLPPVRRDRFRIIHVGTLYKKRNPVPLLESVARLIREGAIPREDVEVTFLGKIALENVRLDRVITDLNLSGVVKLESPIPHADCLRRMAEASVLLIVQPETDLQVPGKLFEYMFLRRPVLALAHPGATADLVERHRLGRVADPESPEEIAEAVKDLYKDTKDGPGGFAVDSEVMERFDVRRTVKDLAAVLDSCLTAVGDSAGGSR